MSLFFFLIQEITLTLILYRADVEEGGETVFPAANMNFSFVPWYNELSACGKKGLSIKPRMGDALLFWSMRPDATLDPSNLHGIIYFFCHKHGIIRTI